MEFGANEGESPVVLRILAHGSPCALESRRLGVLRKMGGKSSKPKYDTETDSREVLRSKVEKNCESKVKST